MRILLVAVYWSAGGGIQSHITNLRQWLRDHGHSVISAGLQRGVANEENNDVIDLPLDRCTGADGGDRHDPAIVRLFWIIRSAITLRRALSRTEVDVVHAHETTPLLVAWLATIGLRRPLIMTFHGASPDRQRSLSLIARLFADYVISPSQTGVDRLAALGVPKDRIVQIGLGVPPFGPLDRDRIARIRTAALGKAGKFLIFSLSRLEPQKGLDAMIRVARKVRETIPGARFVVAGDGPLRPQLEQQLVECNVDDIMTFIGKTDCAGEYLHACDAYLLTSRWEELPISIVEAMRAGLPIVATDCGGVSELVDDNTGRVCDIDDETALANALVEICSNADLKESLAERAKQRGDELRFSVEHINASYALLYQKLINPVRL